VYRGQGRDRGSNSTSSCAFSSGTTFGRTSAENRTDHFTDLCWNLSFLVKNGADSLANLVNLATFTEDGACDLPDLVTGATALVKNSSKDVSDLLTSLILGVRHNGTYGFTDLPARVFVLV
jgi:hypothetical protein